MKAGVTRSPLPLKRPFFSGPNRRTSVHRIFLNRALLLVMCLAVFLACRTPERYTYRQIKADYEPPSAAPKADHRSPGMAGAPLEPLPSVLTLQEAVHLALANNPDVAVAFARIHQSEAMIQEAASAFWPVLTAYAEYMQGDAPSAYLFKTIDQRRLPSGINFNDPGWFENVEVGLQARINLFSGGRDYLHLRMAEAGRGIQELDRKAVENALASSVIQGYFSTLAAADFLAIAEESVQTVQEELRMTEARYEAGGVLKSDVLSLKVRLAEARAERIRARSSHDLALASLVNLMGHDPDSQVTLSERESLGFSVPFDYAAALSEALDRRPELEKIRSQVVQARMAVDAARAGYLPRLDAQGRYYMDDSGLDFGTGRANWTLGLVLNWDFFSGFRSKAHVDRAQWMLREMLAADRKAVLGVQLDVKRACLDLAQAQARLEVTQASTDQAREALRIVKQQYEGGSVTVSRYLDAELAYNRARILSRSAHYDREKAHAAVGRAIGRFSETPYRAGETP